MHERACSLLLLQLEALTTPVSLQAHINVLVPFQNDSMQLTYHKHYLREILGLSSPQTAYRMIHRMAPVISFLDNKVMLPCTAIWLAST